MEYFRICPHWGSCSKSNYQLFTAKRNVWAKSQLNKCIICIQWLNASVYKGRNAIFYFGSAKDIYTFATAGGASQPLSGRPFPNTPHVQLHISVHLLIISKIVSCIDWLYQSSFDFLIISVKNWSDKIKLCNVGLREWKKEDSMETYRKKSDIRARFK